MKAQAAVLRQGIVVNSLKNGSQKGKGHHLLFYSSLPMRFYYPTVPPSIRVSYWEKKPTINLLNSHYLFWCLCSIHLCEREWGCSDSQLDKILGSNKILPFSMVRINYFHASVGLLYYFEPITQDTYNILDSLIASGRLISVFWCSLIWVFPKHCKM